MAISKIGVNLSKINEVAAPNITIETDPSLLISDIVDNVNEKTNNLWGFGSLIVMFIILYTIITNQSQESLFKYTKLRGLVISLGIVCIFAITMSEIGIMYSLYPVGFFVFSFMLSSIFLIFQENR